MWESSPDSCMKGFYTLINRSPISPGFTAFAKYGLPEGCLNFTVSQTVNDRVDEWDNDGVEDRYHFVGIIGIHKLRAGISEKGRGIEENYNC